MRLFYFILYVFLPYSLRFYYPRIRRLNVPNRHLNRTIYVSNHSASFMDPLVFGGLHRPIVFFMTRADIFTPVMKPILWMAHMLPIYRQHDGVDTKGKNAETFKKCQDVLKSGRNLLIFGEGFTDDVFIRRLKPIKKGALRIGFSTLENENWSYKIYISTIGINYGDPNRIGSDLVTSNGPIICLNDYKEEYLKNQNKVISDLNQRIESDLQNQLTHVENEKWVFFHEHISRMRKDCMHPIDRDLSVPLLKRWENSRKLALWMNGQQLDENEALVNLKSDLESYFKLLKKFRISEKELTEYIDGDQKTFLKWMKLFILSPLILLGFLHNYLPYTLIKKFTEKSFRRKVFWSSVKMMLGVVAIGIFNIPILFGLHYWLFRPMFGACDDYAWILSIIYYISIPIFGVIAYNAVRTFKNIQVHRQLSKNKPTALINKRAELLNRIEGIVTDRM